MAGSDSPRAPRPVSDSKVEMTEIVFPNDTNPLGNVMGGRVMHWIDIAAAVAASRHARTPVVTASVDQIDLHNPVPPVRPESARERGRFAAAQERRKRRLAARK